jgi:very-short-patch-repair endonuclease
MRDVRVAKLAGAQFNRVSRAQLLGLGMSDKAIAHRVAAGWFVPVEEGVLAVGPVLDHDWGRWMAATLTAPGSVLSHQSAAAAWGLWSLPRSFETVTRPGSGGPRRHGGLLVFRSTTLPSEHTLLRGIPITSPERTLLDLATRSSQRALARAVRDAVRLQLTTVGELVEYVAPRRHRRGARGVAATLARYAGLPLERARSGAEVRALEILRETGCQMPRLNVQVADEEADLSWPRWRLIVEIDGGPFHLDVGEDARKQACWEAAGWTVRRVDADDVYERPQRLLDALAPQFVPQYRL